VYLYVERVEQFEGAQAVDGPAGPGDGEDKALVLGHGEIILSIVALGRI